MLSRIQTSKIQNLPLFVGSCEEGFLYTKDFLQYFIIGYTLISVKSVQMPNPKSHSYKIRIWNPCSMEIVHSVLCSQIICMHCMKYYSLNICWLSFSPLSSHFFNDYKFSYIVVHVSFNFRITTSKVNYYCYIFRSNSTCYYIFPFLTVLITTQFKLTLIPLPNINLKE